MNKLFFILVFSVLFSCSSSEDNNSNSSNQDETKYINIYNTKYYFDNAIITRSDSGSSMVFVVDLYNSVTTDFFKITLRYIKSSGVPSNYYHDLLSTTYKYNAYSAELSSVSYYKYNNSSNAHNILFNDADFTGLPITINRVSVIKNTTSNYTFDFSFLTSQGNITGSYTGEFIKNGF